MAKLSDFKLRGAAKFTELSDTPNTLLAGKYLKVNLAGEGIDQDDVDATSVSGLENSNNGFPYKYTTTISGDVSGGYLAFDNTNLAAASTFSIHKLSAQNNNLSTWIQSWDDSDNAIKGTLNISSRTNTSKFAMYKVTGTPTGVFGSGADGDVTISGNVNINTDVIASGRSYADGVNYKVSSVGTNSVVTTETPNGIAIGDEVMIHNIRGVTDNVDNVGNYEFVVVSNIVDNTVSFTTNFQKLYGDNGGNTNISNHKVKIQRIPNYANVTINSGSTLTCSAFSTSTGKNGLIAFKCSGTCTVVGNINADYLGYEGGSSSSDQLCYTGGSLLASLLPPVKGYPNYGGGSAGGLWGSRWSGAGGGSYGGSGTWGINQDGNDYSRPGSIYGNEVMTAKIYLGSGGGGGPNSHLGYSTAGKGGGIIIVIAATLDIYGNISSKGQNSVLNQDQWCAGGGSGGSVLLMSSTLKPNASNIYANGGTKGGVRGGDGGDGRVDIYYENITGATNSTPTPHTGTTDTGNNDIFNFLVTWLTNNGTFVADENILVAYSFNY